MLSRIFVKFVKDGSGATAIEYALIAALVSVAAIAALTSLGGSLTNIFTVVDNALVTAATSADSEGGEAGEDDDD